MSPQLLLKLNKTKYYQKYFPDYLHEKSHKLFYLSPTNKKNLNKSVGPNNIPFRILELLKDEVSHLADIYNLSFLTDSFTTIFIAWTWEGQHGNYSGTELCLGILKDPVLQD